MIEIVIFEVIFVTLIEHASAKRTSHENEKALSLFRHKKIFLILENENEYFWVSYIHFLSKIFFMITGLKAFLCSFDEMIGQSGILNQK